MIMSTNFNNIAILNIRGVDYRCIFSKISQSDAISLLENADLSKIVERYQILRFSTMHKQIITFGDKEIKQHKSHRYKNPI